MNKRKEKISAFLDNDMHCDELMSFSLSAESDDAKIAQRYQMLGDALRGEMSGLSFVDVSQPVRDALVNENIFDEQWQQWHKDVPLTNQRMDKDVSLTNLRTETNTTKTKALSEQLSDKPGIFTAWLRPVVGMAVAATVAVVMVVTLSGQETASQIPVAVNLDQQPVTGEAAKIASRVAADDKTIAGEMTDNKAISVDQHLINKHFEFATRDALQGRLPYVRAVGFESKQ